MTPEQFQQVERLFDEACDLGPNEAERLVAARAETDPVVAARVRAMLAADRTLAGGLDRTPFARPATEPAPTEPFPDRVGNYRVERLIGEGGMGRVYLARQANPDRRVALKVLRSGLVSESLRRRFADEAAFLARLQHPGIAQVFESGTFEHGGTTLPYLVMEFVEGDSLLIDARKRDLSTADRVALLAAIAEAAHHAHQRGIIHRDLKPANVLVDAEGRPRILDLGIARAVDSDVDATNRTEAGQLMGTLAYMSPEQLDGRGDVDSRADVYALGVLGYELLADRPPHDLAEHSLPSAIRVVAESQPARLGSIDRRLRGDLETIIERAMEPDPARRYASASELAGDLRRYLTREPILARSPSLGRQLHSFVRRHRALTAGAISAVLALAVGMIATGLALRTAQIEASRAKREASISAAVNAFLNDDLLAAVSPSELGLDARMRDVLDLAATRIDDRFDGQPLVEAAIRETLGNTYRALGEFDLALPHLERSLALRRAHAGEDGAATFRSMIALGWLQKERGDFAAAETQYRGALDGRRAVLGRDHVDTLEAMHHLGSLYNEWGRPADAEPIFSAALAIAERTLGEDDPRTADLMNNTAVLFGSLGRHEEALALHRRTLAATEAAVGPDDPSTLYSVGNVGGALSQLGRHAEAEPMLAAAAAGRARVLGPEHPFTLWSESRHAECLIRLGRSAEADTALAKLRRRADAALPDDHWYHLVFLNTHAAALMALERPDDARAMLEPAVPRAEALLGPDHGLTARLREKLDRAGGDGESPGGGSPAD